jgi:hypothetical protein
MIKYVNRTFASVVDRGTSVRIENASFLDCEFLSCGLSLTKNVERRAIVRNAELIGCRANGCHVGPAIFDGVTISNLGTNDLLLVWGALFQRVTLEGSIGKIKISPFVDAVDRSQATQLPFDEARKHFYSNIEWALDIRNARFKQCELRGIPSRLIRRNVESQVVITRDRALDGSWRDRVSPSNELWPFMIDMFLADGDDDRVLVAPLDVPKNKRDLLLRHLDELRSSGVVQPD